MNETAVSHFDTVIARAAEFAERNFAQHVITERFRVVREDGGIFASWRCGAPNSNNCYFNVTHEPGRIFVTGDIGDLIVERTFNMIAWSRSAVNSIDYFASKVPRAIVTKAFSADLAREWIAEQIEEHKRDNADEDSFAEKLEELEELSDQFTDGGDDFCSEADVYKAIFDSSFYDCEMPRLEVFNGNFLWCREAIRWWLHRINDDGIIVIPSP